MSKKLAILISGNGSNLQAIIDAIASDVLANATICLVISNRKNAYGLERARLSGIETAYLNLLPYGKRYPHSDPDVIYGPAAREAYDADLAEKVLGVKPDLVICAGFMHILSGSFLTPLAKLGLPVINLHPALPGAYDGARAIERAYGDFRKGKTRHTGIMIHYVIREVDRGKPIITQEIDIKTNDSLEDLQERIHAAEHELIIKGIKIALSESPTT